MALIPGKEALGARPTPQPAGGLAQYRFDSESMMEPARALMRVGAGLEQEGDRLYALYKVEQEKADNVRVQDAVNKLKESALDLEIGEANGYRRLHGGAAATRPLLDEYTKKYEAAFAQISGGLATDAQREKFKIHAAPTGFQLREGVARWQMAQGDVYAKQVHDGTVTTSIATATANWDNPLIVASSIASINNSTSDQAERLNWPKPFRDATAQAEISKVHAAVIGQAIASGKTAYAEQWYVKHRDQIDVQTAKVLEVAVRDGEQKELANGYRAEEIKFKGNYKALDELEKRIQADTRLSEDRKNVLINSIDNKKLRIEAKSEAARNRWERAAERGITAFNSNVLAGYPGTDPQAGLDMINAVKGTPLEAEARAAVRLADATRSFAMQPPTRQAELIQQADAAVHKDPTKFDRKIVDAWKQIAARQGEEVKKNPVGFAARQGLVDLIPLDLSAPDKAGPALTQRLEVATALSRRNGVAVQPFQPEEVQIITATLAKQPPEAQVNYFSQLRNGFGRDAAGTRGYMAAMAQLAPDNPVVAVAGSRAIQDPNAAARILRGERYLHPPTKEDGKPARGDIVSLPPLKDFEREFRSYVGDAFAGKPEQRSASIQAVRAAYAAMAGDKPKDADPATINMDFFKQAADTVIGPVAKYNGNSVVLPYGSSKGDFEDGVKRLVQFQFDSGLKTDYTPQRLLDLPLKNRGDGRYVFMSGDSVVTDKSGKDIVVDFNNGVPWQMRTRGPTSTDGQPLRSRKPEALVKP